MKVSRSNNPVSVVTAGRRCRHCGLSLHEATSDSFCCSGCAVAFDAISRAGLSDTYYSLRQMSDRALGIPVRNSATSRLSKQQITSSRFIEESTAELNNGYRRVCLSIDGLTCAACGWLAEQVADSQPGVQRSSVNLPDSTMTLQFDAESASLPQLLDALGRFGYELHPRNHRTLGPSPQEKRLLLKVGVSWALAGNIMLLAFALYSGLTLENDWTLATAARWASFLIATIAVGYGGSVFFRAAIASVKIAVRNRSLYKLHIDTPISLGILVGYANSAWATISGSGDVWFDSIAILIAALITARWLQARSQRTAAQAAARLLDMVPSTSRRILADGSEEYVASSEIDAGQTIRVDPDEIIPIDGTVLSGRSNVNNAVITGESALVSVDPGCVVFAGSINESSPLIIKAQSSGRRTRVGQLLEWIDQSRQNQADVVQLTDRISGIFVVSILAAAVGTAVTGFFLFPESVAYRIVALLVISCPCALGMATPLAIAAANGKAARRGIYIKDGATVESLARVSVVVFDKTGTLTNGNLSIASFTGADESLMLAAALEEYASHPIADAFRAAAARSGSGTSHATTDIEVLPGLGVRGTVDGRAVSVGKPEWILEHSRPDASLQAAVQRVANAGLTPVAIAVDRRMVAIAGCGDRIRPTAVEQVRLLRERKIRVLLLSGDHPTVAHAVAKQVGIAPEDTRGAVGPEEKRHIIEELSRSEVVMMIGDGANDAAALRAAQVGVAVGNDNAPCLVASDIFVPDAAAASAEPLLTFGTRVMRLIRRNLGISLAYNVVAGSAAIMGFVTPLVAAIAMPLSSLYVVSTSVAVAPFATADDERRRTPAPIRQIQEA